MVILGRVWEQILEENIKPVDEQSEASLMLRIVYVVRLKAGAD